MKMSFVFYNILVINTRLQYLGLKANQLCTFRKHEEESIVNLLWECNSTKEFLKPFYNGS